MSRSPGAATFLPAYRGGLFSRRLTKAGALASMGVGFVTPPILVAPG